MGYQKTIVFGHIGKNAENKTLESGSIVTTFSVAVSEKYKDKSSGEAKTDTTWYECVLWNRSNMAQYLKKGDKVLLEGKVSADAWYNDVEGKAMSRLKLTVFKVEFGGSASGNNAQTTSEEAPTTGGDDSDLPF